MNLLLSACAEKGGVGKALLLSHSSSTKVDKTVYSDKRGWNGRGTSNFNHGAKEGKTWRNTGRPKEDRARRGHGEIPRQTRGKADFPKRRLRRLVSRALRESYPGQGLRPTREGNLPSGPAPAPPREGARPAPKGRGDGVRTLLLGVD